jgi:hypothetical protein
VTIRYSNGTTTNRPMDVVVNGVTVQSGVAFGATTNWDTWVDKTLTLNLAAGSNTIRLVATTANGGPNVDYIDVAPAVTVTRYEAENATISQGVVEANHLNYSGTGFVNNDNVAGSYTQFTITAASAGTYQLVLRYSNGTTANRPADLAFDGTVLTSNAFVPTANWDTWANVTVTVSLAAGQHAFRVTGTTANGPANLDYLEVTG